MPGTVDHATEGLEIAVDEGGNATVVRLKGRLGIESSPDFRDRLLAVVLSPAPKAVVVDVAELSYIDAAGIATLLEALKIARSRHMTLSLRGLRGRPLHLFDVTGVLHLFETIESGSDASSSSSSSSTETSAQAKVS